jgi:hypothetical protein
MKKICILILIFAAVTGFVWSAGAKEGASAGKPAAPAQLNFSTGSMGGGFYAIGGGIADYLTKNVPGVQVTAVTSGGVNENINRLDSGQAEIGLVNTIDPPLAFEGKEPYKKKFDKMRGVGILYLQYGQPYTLKSTGIKTYADLKGKTVCVGSPGGSMHQQFYDWVRAHGLDPEKDFKGVFLPAREAMEALKTGQIDAVMETSTLPTPTMSELSLTHDISIIGFAPGVREKLVAQLPKYLMMTIPAGAYKGLDSPVDTVGSGAMWAVRADLNETLVYNMVKAVYSKEGLAYLGKVHAAGTGVSLENAAKWRPIPLHPGAEKFFKEAGVLK